MKRIFQKQLTADKDNVDTNGHVNNVVYVGWMQDVAVDHAINNGCDQELLAQFNAIWVARSHYIEYRQPAFEKDKILVETWLASKRRVGCQRKYRFLRQADGELSEGDLLAVAETAWVFVDALTGRPKKMPDEVTRLFEVVDRE